MKQLSAMDGQFLSAESRKTPEHIGLLAIYDPSTARDGFVRFKDVLRHFEIRIDRAPIFTQKLKKVPFELDQPYWVEAEDFDLEHHVRHIALPKPGDWRQLCIQISRLHSQRMDFDRPLWTAYVIEGLDNIKRVPEGSFALYVKMHHAAVDGMAGGEFIQAIHDLSPVFPDGEYGDSGLYGRQVPPAPSGSKLLFNSYINSWKHPLNMAKLGMGIVPQKLRERKFRQEKGMDPKGPPKPDTLFNDMISPNRVYGGMEFPLSKIQEIRKAVAGVTVNDVATAVCSRAMRTYLAANDGLPDDSLLSMVPISLRGAEEAKDGGNSISIVNVPIHTDIEDPLELLETVHATMKLAKAQRIDVGESLEVQLINSVPNLMQTGINRLMNATTKMGRSAVPVNTTISNVPGVPVPLYFAGAKAVKVHGIGFLQHGLGLFHSITSYNGELCMSFLACREMMPDPEVYHKMMEQAFSDIYNAAIAAAPAKAAKPRKPAKPVKAKKPTAKKISAAKNVNVK